MENITCQRCQTTNEFNVAKAGPHLKAICDHCNRYIKFLPRDHAAPNKASQVANPALRIMSNTLYNGSICLTDIPKDKITVSEKNGKKYLNIDLWIDTDKEADQYGNICGIKVSQTKAEREAKTKAQYIGNLKAPRKQEVAGVAPAAQQAATVPDDLPF